MTLQLSSEQQEALQRGETVRISATGVGEVVVLRAAAFDDALAEQRELADLARLARRAADSWAAENPY
jgi:hypothetical protein